MSLKRFFTVCIVLGLVIPLSSQQWKILNQRTISKDNPVSYSDNIEMAGKKVAGIISYSVASLVKLNVEREIIYPQTNQSGKYIERI